VQLSQQRLLLPGSALMQFACAAGCVSPAALHPLVVVVLLLLQSLLVAMVLLLVAASPAQCVSARQENKQSAVM
jgi:hypothetical protein